MIPLGHLYDAVGIQTNCGNSGDDFTKLQLVKNSCLSGCIKTNHQYAHLLLPPEPIEQSRERETHDCGGMGKGSGIV